MEALLFYAVATIAIIFGLLVVTCKNPVNNALSLVMTFVCFATFYVMLEAPFMAAIQIMVYAGAIMVLILFVIMLLNLGDEKTKITHSLVLGGIAGVAVLAQAIYFLTRSQVAEITPEITSELIQQYGHTELIGKAIFGEFLLPFEITSILLLVAIVGAVILAKREV